MFIELNRCNLHMRLRGVVRDITIYHLYNHMTSRRSLKINIIVFLKLSALRLKFHNFQLPWVMKKSYKVV